MLKRRLVFLWHRPRTLSRLQSHMIPFFLSHLIPTNRRIIWRTTAICRVFVTYLVPAICRFFCHMPTFLSFFFFFATYQPFVVFFRHVPTVCRFGFVTNQPFAVLFLFSNTNHFVVCWSHTPTLCRFVLSHFPTFFLSFFFVHAQISCRFFFASYQPFVFLFLVTYQLFFFVFVFFRHPPIRLSFRVKSGEEGMVRSHSAQLFRATLPELHPHVVAGDEVDRSKLQR